MGSGSRFLQLWKGGFCKSLFALPWPQQSTPPLDQQDSASSFLTTALFGCDLSLALPQVGSVSMYTHLAENTFPGCSLPPTLSQCVQFWPCVQYLVLFARALGTFWQKGYTFSLPELPKPNWGHLISKELMMAYQGINFKWRCVAWQNPRERCLEALPWPPQK